MTHHQLKSDVSHPPIRHSIPLLFRLLSLSSPGKARATSTTAGHFPSHAANDIYAWKVEQAFAHGPPAPRAWIWPVAERGSTIIVLHLGVRPLPDISRGNSSIGGGARMAWWLGHVDPTYPCVLIDGAAGMGWCSSRRRGMPNHAGLVRYTERRIDLMGRLGNASCSSPSPLRTGPTDASFGSIAGRSEHWHLGGASRGSSY